MRSCRAFDSPFTQEFDTVPATSYVEGERQTMLNDIAAVARPMHLALRTLSVLLRQNLEQ